MEIMNYAILAAGEGSRLSREGIGVPKPLVEVGGETMLGRLIRIFMRNGAGHIAVITNDMTSLTSDYVRKLADEGLPISLKVKSTPSSMHSFYELRDMIGSDRFCLTTVDTIFREEEFGRYVREFAATGHDALMAVTDYVDDEKPLYVAVDEKLRVTGFHDEACGTRYVSGGIYCLDGKCVEVLEKCVAAGQSRMRNFQRALVSEGLDVRAYPFSKIIDVDHRDDIAKAELFLRL